MANQQDKREYFLLKGLNKAIRDYDMVADGDRIAVAVSGGKDSFALLRLLWARRPIVYEDYELVAAHVAPDPETCGGGDASAATASYAAKLGLEHVVVPMEPPSGKPRRPNQSPCFHCAWRRRKALFQIAEQMGCNKVALGHHADDLAQTTLMNVFFQGRAETMEPKVSFFGGKLILIRPLAYTREKEIVRFAKAADFQVVSQPCANTEQSRRALMRQIIEQVDGICPKVRINLMRAGLQPRDADANAEERTSSTLGEPT